MKETFEITHENLDLEEKLHLRAFHNANGWFVNVSTNVEGKQQYGIVSVPLEIFKDLIEKCKEEN